jgi:histone deacetylase 1/2
MDTGTTSHTSESRGNISSYFPLSNSNQKVIVVSGHEIPIHGTGHTQIDTSQQPLNLNHVMHAPNIIKNLISVRLLTTDNNVSVCFDPFGFTVSDFQTGIPLMRCDNHGDLYPVTIPPSFVCLTSSLWHDRLGHPSVSVLNSLRKNKFICCEPFNSSVICDSCVLGKQVKLPFFNSQTTTLMPFDILHSGLWTSPILSSAGHKYYVLFLDDFTNFLWTFPISRKSQVFETFKSLTKLIQTHFLQNVKSFQCDNGGEYINELFRKYCTDHGLIFRFSCPHSSSQNGKAERKIRTTNNMIRTMLAHSSVPTSFWHQALHMATYLLNILPHKTLQNQSLTQLLYHRDPTYTHLRVFGCLCYPLILSSTIHKLQPRSTPCVFLGYTLNHRGCKCFDLSKIKLIISLHVIFDETLFPFTKIHSPSPHSYDFLNNDLHPYIVHQWQNQILPPDEPTPTTISDQPPFPMNPINSPTTTPSSSPPPPA